MRAIDQPFHDGKRENDVVPLLHCHTILYRDTQQKNQKVDFGKQVFKVGVFTSWALDVNGNIRPQRDPFASVWKFQVNNT